MHRLGLLGFAVQYAPRIVQIRRRTWIGFGVGLLLLFGLAIGAVLALIVWFFSQAQGWTGSMQELLADPAGLLMQQVEHFLSAVREQLDGLFGALSPVEEDEAGALRNNSEDAEK